jgi:hypothetical protein
MAMAIYNVYKMYMRNKYCKVEVEAKIIECWHGRRSYLENKRILCNYEYNSREYSTTIVLKSKLDALVYNKGDYITIYIDPYRPKSAIIKGMNRTSRYVTSIIAVVVAFIMCILSFVPDILKPGGFIMLNMAKKGGLDYINTYGGANDNKSGYISSNKYKGNSTTIPIETPIPSVSTIPTKGVDTIVLPTEDAYGSTRRGINGVEYNIPNGMIDVAKDNCRAYMDSKTKGKKEYMYVYAIDTKEDTKIALASLMRSFKLNKSNFYKKVNLKDIDYYIYIVSVGNGKKEFVTITTAGRKKVAIRYLYSKDNEKNMLGVLNTMYIRMEG